MLGATTGTAGRTGSNYLHRPLVRPLKHIHSACSSISSRLQQLQMRLAFGTSTWANFPRAQLRTLLSVAPRHLLSLCSYQQHCHSKIYRRYCMCWTRSTRNDHMDPVHMPLGRGDPPGGTACSLTQGPTAEPRARRTPPSFTSCMLLLLWLEFTRASLQLRVAVHMAQASGKRALTNISALKGCRSSTVSPTPAQTLCCTSGILLHTHAGDRGPRMPHLAVGRSCAGACARAHPRI